MYDLFGHIKDSGDALLYNMLDLATDDLNELC